MQEDFFDAYIRTESKDCPLSRIQGHINSDGLFETHEYPEPKTYDESEYFRDPGFLIVYLDSADDENDIFSSQNKQMEESIFKAVEAIFAYCLYLPVREINVGTFTELKHKLHKYGPVSSHIILIGHGGTEGISFLDQDKPVSGKQLAEVFDFKGKKLQVLSLCCHSGCEDISREISQANGVSSVIAPNGVFHTAWGIHFVTGYLINYFLNTKSVHDAVSQSIIQPDKTPMCVWKKGTVTYTSTQE